MRRSPLRATQRGSVLLVVMILLLVFAVMAAASFRGSLTSVQAIGNMQWRNEAITAANDAIDRILSTADFATKTATVTALVNNPDGSPLQVDVNGDGVNDISVSFPVVSVDGIPRAGPRCLRAAPIDSKKLDPEKLEDVGCFGSSTSSSSGLGQEVTGGGTSTVAQPPSLCSDSEWTITVRATDAVTRTSVDVVQGVGVRVPTTAIPVCN